MTRIVLMCLALILPVTALAIDLTGTYEGKRVCKGLNKTTGEPVRAVSEPGLVITQVGNEVRMRIRNTVQRYLGQHVTEGPVIGIKGQALLVRCNPSQDATSDAEIVYFRKAKKKAGIRLKLVGVSRRSTPSEIGECKWTYKRISEADPNVLACP